MNIDNVQILKEHKSNNLITIVKVEAGGKWHKFESKPYDAGDIKSLQDAVNKLNEETLAYIKELMLSSFEHHITIATTSNFLVKIDGELYHNQRELN